MELNLEGVVVGAASLLVIGAFHPLVIWCEYRFTQRIWPVFLIAGLLCLLAALWGLVCSGTDLRCFGAFGGRLPVEHPGAEGAGQAGGTWVVSQKSKEKIADCRGSDQLLRGSLFLDRRNGGLYNCFIVSYC